MAPYLAWQGQLIDFVLVGMASCSRLFWTPRAGSVLHFALSLSLP